MINIASSLVESIGLSIPNPNHDGEGVSVSIFKTSKQRRLTVVKSSDVSSLECGNASKIETYHVNIDMDSVYLNRDHVVINDNREVVGKYVIYCGTSALRSYITQDGKVLQIRSSLFYYENSYGDNIKSEDYFQAQMIKNKCYFDTFESALELIKELAKKPESEIFGKF